MCPPFEKTRKVNSPRNLKFISFTKDREFCNFIPYFNFNEIIANFGSMSQSNSLNRLVCMYFCIFRYQEELQMERGQVWKIAPHPCKVSSNNHILIRAGKFDIKGNLLIF